MAAELKSHLEENKGLGNVRKIQNCLIIGAFCTEKYRKNINLSEMSKFRQVELLTNKYSNTK